MQTKPSIIAVDMDGTFLTDSKTFDTERFARILPACIVLLGRMALTTTPARSARLRRATRPHDAQDHTCAVCPPTSCSSAT